MEPSASSDARTLARYLRPERASVAVLAGVLVVAMVLPVAGPLLLGHIVDAALAGDPTSTLVAAALAYLVVTLTADGLQLAVTWWAVRLAWRVGNRLRHDLAEHALRLDLAWHGEHTPGLLIERIDGDVEAIVKFSSTAVLQLAGNAVLLVGVFAVSLVIDWRAGLVIGTAVVVAAALMAGLRSVAVPAHDAEREVTGQLFGDLEERLGGLEDLRANGAGSYVVHRLEQRSARWWAAARRAAFIGDGAWAAAATAFTVGSMATLGLGLWLNRQGELTIGSTLALFRFSQMVRQPVEAIAEQLREFQKAAAGIRRTSRLLATVPRIVDGPGPGTPVPPGPLAVDLDHVTFAYAPGPPALAGVDLHLAPGTVLGVIGRTGSGKTTLGRLLLRFWDVSGGAVRLGGVDVRAASQAQLRRRVAVVTQEVELFRASLRDNLTRFGAVAATDARLVAALAEVGLERWYGGLADGLDTAIEGGTGLSAGEAQLLAFARVLLADPGLVVLDEATSRLDPDTEARVTRATERILAGRTVVLIAHRLATLDRADEILVLEQGRVVEHGRRADLADDPDSRYARLHARSAGARRELVAELT